MKTKNTLILIAGILNLLTFLLHVVGGQLDLINPLQESNLSVQVKTELLGVWHMVSFALLATTVVMLKFGFKADNTAILNTLKSIGYLYLLFSLAFIVSGIINQTFAPQWILLLPIGILTLLGTKKHLQQAL